MTITNTRLLIRDFTLLTGMKNLRVRLVRLAHQANLRNLKRRNSNRLLLTNLKRMKIKLRRTSQIRYMYLRIMCHLNQRYMFQLFLNMMTQSKVDLSIKTMKLTLPSLITKSHTLKITELPSRDKRENRLRKKLKDRELWLNRQLNRKKKLESKRNNRMHIGQL